MGFTPQQLDAINAKGKTIVSASAGSGKTTVMIEKIIKHICEDTGVERILAVTFTKKAAAQMKEKLGKALIKNINDPTKKAQKQRFKIELQKVASADFSTIHSFCSKLIRSHFYKAEVDSNFRVIDGGDAEGVTLKNLALEEVLEEGYASKDEDFQLLLSVYARRKNDDRIKRVLLSSYASVRDKADYRAYLENEKAYDESAFDEICVDLHKKFLEKCRYYYGLIEDELAYFNATDGGKPKENCEGMLAWLDAFLATKTYFEASKVETPELPQNRGSKKDSAERLKRTKRVGALKKKLGEVVKTEFGKLEDRQTELEKFRFSGQVAKAICKYLRLFDDKYGALKTERGVLDYNDLEHKALKLLSEEEVAKEMQDKYDYVFVDEYQDVNPVQEAIVSKVAKNELFLVGDVKQAIYGFRGSKSDFFVQKQGEFSDGNIFLPDNFRSDSAVLDAVNTLFSLTMTKHICSVDYAREGVMKLGDERRDNKGRVFVHFLDKDEEKEKEKRGVYSVKEKTGNTDVAVSQSAKRIYNIIMQERAMDVVEPDGSSRRVEFSDVAILSRKKSGQISKTVAYLAEMGVPVVSSSAVNICDYAEIKTLIDILSLLDNAEQDVPLCSALLSTMGGLTADELADIRLAYPKETYFRNACKKYSKGETATAEKLKKFFAYYAEMRKQAHILSAGELLTKLLSDTGMEARILARKNGVSCMKRVRRFIEETGGDTPLCLREFLDKLRDMNYKIDYSENGGDNSVKVMTMHASKGLEFPIVILDNLSGEFDGGETPEVYAQEKYGFAPYGYDTARLTKSSTLLRRLASKEKKESEIKDALNLYYVAMTRAKNRLHLVFDREDKDKAPDAKYARSFAEFTDFSALERYFAEDEFADPKELEREAYTYQADEGLTQEIVDAYTWQYAHLGCDTLSVKSSATKLMQDDAPDEQDAGFGKARELKGALFDEDDYDKKGDVFKDTGIAYHAFLEYFDFSLLYDGDRRVEESLLRARIQTILAELSQNKIADVSLLKEDKLVEILQNPVFNELRGATLYKERQFLVGLPACETYVHTAKDVCPDEEVLFQGAIDLLAVGETVRIVDYKYSQKDAEYLRAHYKPQLDLYKKATAKILRIDEKQIRCTIVNICKGFQVEMD